MAVRIPVRARSALVHLLLASCAPTNPERCTDLLAVTDAQVRELGRGCATAADCIPFAAACNKPAAVRADRDTRDATRYLLRYEALCGCSGGGANLAPAVCVGGQCL